MIGRKTQFCPITHGAGQLVEVLAVHKTATVMSGLGPGVGKEQENAVEDGRRQGRHQKPNIFVKNTNIAEIGLVDQPRQGRDPIAKRLAPDKSDAGMGRRLGRKVFAGAKPDFEPDRGRCGEEVRRVPVRQIGGGDPKSIKDRFEPGTTTRAQGVAAAATVEMRPVGGLGARGVAHPAGLP